MRKAISSDIGVASAVKMCRSVSSRASSRWRWSRCAPPRHFGAGRSGAGVAQPDVPRDGLGQGSAGLPDQPRGRARAPSRRGDARGRAHTQTMRASSRRCPLAIAANQDALVDTMAMRGLSYDKNGKFSWRAFADALASSAGRGGRRRAGRRLRRRPRRSRHHRRFKETVFWRNTNPR